MEYLKIVVFAICVLGTLDYITDTIEALSGNSEDHRLLKETQSDARYMLLVVFCWAIFYALVTLY